MAVVCNSATDYLERTANVPAIGASTIAGWFKRTDNTRDTYEILIVNRWDTNTYKELMGIYPTWEIPPRGPAIANAQGGGIQSYSDGSNNREPNTTDWYYYALTSDSSNTKGYFYSWNGSSLTLVNSTVLSITNYAAGTSADYLAVMSDSPDSRYAVGKCCYIRVWDAALSQSEIEAEAIRNYVYRTSNINTALGACTSSSFANDVSGNGRNWTLGAGLSTSDYDSDVPSGLMSSGPTYIPRMSLLGVG